MAKIRVNVFGPGKRHQLWRLPTDAAVGTFVATVAGRMGLPTKLSWSFVPRANGKAIDSDDTLAAARVQPGAALELRPVPDKVLKLLLEELYGEAEGYVQDELWSKALEKLRELHEYDPRFPDPGGLMALAEAGVAPSLIASVGVPGGLVLGGLAAVGAVVVMGAAVVGGGAYVLWQAVAGDGARPHEGDVQITLDWVEEVDLDLHVYDPDGFHICHQNQLAPSGGELDVDANYPCSKAVSSPLENVYWPWDGAPTGTYQVEVWYHSDCSGAGAVDYRVTVRVDGNVLDVYSGTISPHEELSITRFDY